MKIINQKDHSTFMSVTQNNEVLFTNPYLQAAYKEQGIAIPPSQKANFGGKSIVRIGDPEFARAFVEFYYTHEMDHDVFKLER